MKKMILLITALFYSEYCYTQTDTNFTSLKGFQDSSGNAYLYYVEKFSKHFLDEVSVNSFVDSTIFIHNVFDLKNKTNTHIVNGSETIYYPENYFQQSRIDDIEFLNNEPKKIIYVTNSFGIDPSSSISSYNSPYLLGLLGFIDDLYISPTNPNNIYAVTYNWVLRSFDEGLTWPDDSSFIFEDNSIKYLTFSPFDENIIYGINISGNLTRSNNRGKIFEQVTNATDWYGDIELFFDQDQNHIYATINHYENNNNHSDISGLLYISDNNGLINSWKLLQTTSNNIKICIDDSTSGNVFISSGNEILKSTDYGNNFTKIIELPHHANGLYKDPLGDLYASTPNTIFKISEDSLSCVLTKPINRSFNFYPISVGNKWFYLESGTAYDSGSININNIYNEEITKDSVDLNGTKYFFLQSYYESYWLRLDSLTGNIYKKSTLEDFESLIYSLTYNSGDEMETENGIIYNVVEKDTVLWEDLRHLVTYRLYSLNTYQITFGMGLGIINKANSFDFGHTELTLLGCVIDGKVYGDTTTVGITSSQNILTKFSLYQNYPNPFNPNTKIKFAIPKESEVRIEVYNILGEKVTELLNKILKPGIHEIEFNNYNILPSGIYFYRIHAGNFVETKKMILLK